MGSGSSLLRVLTPSGRVGVLLTADGVSGLLASGNAMTHGATMTSENRESSVRARGMMVSRDRLNASTLLTSISKGPGFSDRVSWRISFPDASAAGQRAQIDGAVDIAATEDEADAFAGHVVAFLQQRGQRCRASALGELMGVFVVGPHGG
jgi:hypothetical protein